MSFLLESTSPDVWVRRDVEGLDTRETSLTETTRDLSKYAIMALGLSGNATAAAHLRSLRDQAGVAADERAFRTQVGDVVSQSLQLNEEISRDGLLDYYRTSE